MTLLRTVCSVLLIFTIPLRLLAQDDEIFGEQKRFEGRLIFGGNITQVDGDTYSGYHKVGLHVGPSVYTHFNNKWGVSMDILYSQKGTRGGDIKESYAIGTYIDKYYLNLNYVEVPVTLHYKWNYFFDFEGGIAYCRLVKSKEWAETDVPVYIDPSLAYFNKTDIDYIAGLTLQFHKHWYGSMRLQYSAVTIRPWDRVYPRYGEYGVNQYNNQVVFRLIYKL